MLLAVGLVILTRVPADGSYAVDVLPALLPLGIGFGMAMPAVATLAMSAPPDSDSGAGVGPLHHHPAGGRRPRPGGGGHAGRRPHRRPAGRRPRPAEALTGGYHVAYGVGAGLVVAAFVVAAVFLRPAVDAEAAGPAKEG